MANIVLGIGCAHTPQLHTPADKWEIRAVRDTQDGVPMWYHGERMTYAEVLEKRKHLNLDAQTAMEIREERLQNSYKAIDKLSGIFADAKPDVAIVFGNDQGEMFLRDIKPAFTIMGWGIQSLRSICAKLRWTPVSIFPIRMSSMSRTARVRS